MSASRETIRTQLADLIRANVTSAAAVEDAEPNDLGSATPLVVVSVVGGSRPRLTFANSQLKAKLVVDIYVILADGQTVCDAKETARMLDAVEADIAAVVERHQRHGVGWEAVDWGESTIETGIFNEDGILRARERIPLTISVFG